MQYDENEERDANESLLSDRKEIKGNPQYCFTESIDDFVMLK